MSKTAVRLFCWVLIVCFPLSSVWAQANSALLYMSGVVRVNGVQMSRTLPLSEGDTIETQKDAPVTIAAKGAVVNVAGSSKVVYGKQSLQLEHGSASFNAKRSLTVRVANLTVSPKQGKGHFAVSTTEEGVLIAALNAPVLVTGGAKVIEVATGSTVSLPTSATQDEKTGGAVVTGTGTNTGAFVGIMTFGIAATFTAATLIQNLPASPRRP